MQQNKNQFDQVIGFPVDNWTTRPLPPRKIIPGQYCRLEPLNVAQHGQQLFAAFRLNNPGDTWTYLPYGPFDTYAEFESWLTKAEARQCFFTIIDTETQTPQGVASYHEADPAHGVIEVGGIHYSKALQKSRAATEVMYLMMQLAFDELGYRCYKWRCNALNQGSRKAAERLGFQFEGIARQAYVFKGHNRDTAWYSIIDSEWPALKAKFLKWLSPDNFDAQGNQKLRLQDI
jgi:RimJ/RimL family protein N-acetyltransferase